MVSEFRAADRGRTLHLQSCANTDGEWDRERMRQVVSNLIGNAMAYGDETGSVEVSLATEDSDVILTVTNRGTPIPADALPTLFDPFVRGASQPRSSSFHRPRSIGLGLYIVREVVMAHGGSVAVTSSAAAGTAFKVRLPRRA